MSDKLPPRLPGESHYILSQDEMSVFENNAALLLPASRVNSAHFYGSRKFLKLKLGLM